MDCTQTRAIGLNAGRTSTARRWATILVTRLVVEQAGGGVVGPMTDVVVPEQEAKTAGRDRIVVRVSEVQRMLGTTLEDAVLAGGRRGGDRISGLNEAVVEQVLTALGCELEPTRAVAGEYAVKLPSWRLDLEREIDLIEEVARVYGYNRFADTLPGWAGAVVKQPHAEQERVIRETLRALGYSEGISSTFVSAEEAAAFGDAKAGRSRDGQSAERGGRDAAAVAGTGDGDDAGAQSASRCGDGAAV